MSKVHLDDFVGRLRLDRRRSFIITGRPGEGKTHLAVKMAKKYNGQYLDLLAIFADEPNLAAEVDIFDPARCKKFLQQYVTGDLVLVDEIEFLWHRWDEREKREFLNIIKLWSKPAFFGVFLPTDVVIEQFEMLDQDRHTRIFSIHDLLLNYDHKYAHIEGVSIIGQKRDAHREGFYWSKDLEQ